MRFTYRTLFFLLALAVVGSVNGRKTSVVSTVTNANTIAAPAKQANETSNKTQNELLKSIANAKAEGNIKKQIIGSFALGNLYFKQQKLAESRILFSWVATTSYKRESTLDSLVSLAYLRLSQVAYLQTNFQESIVYLRKAEMSLKNIQSRKNEILVMIGGMWMGMPDRFQPEGYKKAVYYLETAEKAVNVDGERKHLGTILNNEGHAYMKLQEWRKCEEKLNQCIALKDVSSDVLESAKVTLGESYYAQKKIGKALRCLEEVHRHKSKDGHYAYGTVKLAQIYLEIKNYQKVPSLLKEAEDFATAKGWNELLIDIYKLRSELNNALGKNQEALLFYKKYDKLKDSLLGKETIGALQSLDIKFRNSEANRKLLARQLFIKKQGQLIQRKNLQILILIFAFIILAILSVAIYNRRKHLRKLELQNSRIDLLKATALGEEKERQRIAQELHDGIGGMLAVVNMNMQSAKRDGFKNDNHNDKILKMLSAISADVRKTAHNLLPTALEQHGLAKAIKILCEDVCSGDENITIDLEVEGDIGKVERAFNITIYRIIQELIQNILKHSGATHIVIIIERADDNLSINVDDNGKGYNLQLAEKECLGLRSIRKRVASLGGRIQMRSEQDIGTSVSMLFKYLT